MQPEKRKREAAADRPPLLKVGTQGEAIRRLRAGRFLLTETWHPGGLKLHRHAHERASINLLLQGSIRETLATGDVECRPGSLLVKPPGSYHSNAYGTRGARSLLLEIDHAFLTGDDADAPLFQEFREMRGAPIASLAGRLYQESQVSDTARPLIVEGMILQLIGLARRQLDAEHLLRRPPRWLKDVREHLQESFTPEDTVASMAGEAGTDPRNLERMFRRHYGIALGDQLRKSRLEWAATQLTRTERSVGEIALSAGFYDQSHFTRHFRREFGMPPGRFRQSARD